MPLMMDEEMDVDMDDLFGDGAGLSLPTRPPARALYRRIDDLRRTGCCRGIAWSAWGSIASITADGMGVELRNPRCHPDTGEWGLSKPEPLPPLSSNHDGGPLQHLAWSPNGQELAIIDASGRILVVQLFNSLNKIHVYRSNQLDPADDLHEVVGFSWLNPPLVNRNNTFYGPVMRDANQYRYEHPQMPQMGPTPPPLPGSNSVMVCVTSNGLVRLLWPSANGRWSETHTELESIVSSEDLITHAAICLDKTRTMIIAYSTTSQQIYTVRVGINWMPPTADKNAKPMLNPTMITKNLASTSWGNQNMEDGMDMGYRDTSLALLSHLEFLQPTPDIPNGMICGPTILIIRSHVPPLASHYNQETYSVIDRWELSESSQSVHSAFDSLNSRSNSSSANLPNIQILNRLESLTVNKVILSVDVTSFGRELHIAYSDGSIEYRDRETLAELSGSLESFTHLAQLGYTYPEGDPFLQIAFSTTHLSYAQIGLDGKVSWKCLEYTNHNTNHNEAHTTAVVAALTMACATSAVRQASYNDILAIAKKSTVHTFTEQLSREIQRVLNLKIDFADDAQSDALIRNVPLQVLFSIQNSLGFRGQKNLRTFPSQFSFILLQLRHVVVLITMASNIKLKNAEGGDASPLDEPDVIHGLTGSIRWSLDLMAWLIDSLSQISWNSIPSNLELLNSHLKATNSVGLHILLCSISRGFLSSLVQRILNLDFIARKAMSVSDRITPALREAYIAIATLTNASEIKLQTFFKLIEDISTACKENYHAKGINANTRERIASELPLITGAAIPPVFGPVITNIFSTYLPTVTNEIDTAKLFFQDFTALQLGGETEKGKIMDCSKREWVSLSKEKRIKRCVRCAATMEDLPPGKGLMQWMSLQFRKCYCGEYWDVLAPGESVA